MSGFRLISLTILLTTAASVSVWLEVQRVGMGYRLSGLSAHHAALRTEQRELENEVARARAPGIVERHARERGLPLAAPAAGAVVSLDPSHPELARVTLPVPVEVRTAERPRR